MQNDLTLSYFDNAINSLVETLGISETVKANKFVKLVTSKKYKSCINQISEVYKLPISFNVKVVPKGYRPGKSHFKSSGLSHVDETGKGAEGITAQISIPAFVPLFGSPNLRNVNANVIVGEECSECPKTFIFIMAHEVAHILLESLRHPEKHNEFYTDLVALILGFSEIAADGRKTVKETETFYNTITTTTTTYGYLNDEQFKFAQKQINNILESYRAKANKSKSLYITTANKTKKLSGCIENFKSIQKDIAKYGKNRIAVEDGQELVRLFDLNYADSWEKTLQSARTVIKEYHSTFGNIKHYNQKLLCRLVALDNKLADTLKSLNIAIRWVKEDIALLNRNMKLSYKVHKFFVK